MELRPYQRESVDAVWAHLRERRDNPCVVLPTGCHGADHPILMHDGSIRKVQEVRVGDRVMGDDSTPRTVLALCRGREPLYRVVPHRGPSFVVNAGHLLSLVSTNEGKGAYPCQQTGGEITNITLREYLGKSKSWRHLRKLYHVSVDFGNHADLPIPPYILGLLLGDGRIVDGVMLTNLDEGLGDAFTQYAHSLGCGIRVDENATGVPNYHLIVHNGQKNPVLDALEEMGLRGCTCGDKFIPSAYLTASRDARMQLMAGLLDTDGHLGKVFDYVSQSRELADDMAFLARSLGYMANVREKYSACQTGAGGWYYRVCISGDLAAVPCRRKRNLEYRRERKAKKDVLRTGFTVEPLPEGDYYGFILDGNHLYVDGNFFVHHNSGKSLVLAEICRQAVTAWNGRVLVLAHVQELVEQNAAKLQAMLPSAIVGIHSAGLRKRDYSHQVIAAGIQSVYRKACDLGRFNLIVIDEAHLLPPEGEGMYRAFIGDAKVVNPEVRVIGLTATPFRLSSGDI